MREIKFRGKRIDNGEWVYGHYFVSPLTDENSGVPAGCGWHFLSDGVKRHCISSKNGVVYVVDEKTVSQSTGLLDKNGKEIYEGDILDNCWFNKNYLIEDLQSFFEMKGWREEEGFSNFNATVIGNIYENPELIK